MGWSLGHENGRDIGYSVAAECDVEGCDVEIDRGLAYRCGGPKNLSRGEPGCGAYVCSAHNYFKSCAICDGACALCEDEQVVVKNFSLGSEGRPEIVPCPNCVGVSNGSLPEAER